MRNPVKDRIAIVGVGATRFSRNLGAVTAKALAAQACKLAILDAGLRAGDIDGMCGPAGLAPEYSQADLGIPELRWWGISSSPQHLLRVVDAMNALFAGACDYVLVYHALFRDTSHSRTAAQDPFRARASPTHGRAPNPYAQFYAPYRNRR